MQWFDTRPFRIFLPTSFASPFRGTGFPCCFSTVADPYPMKNMRWNNCCWSYHLQGLYTNHYWPFPMNQLVVRELYDYSTISQLTFIKTIIGRYQLMLNPYLTSRLASHDMTSGKLDNWLSYRLSCRESPPQLLAGRERTVTHCEDSEAPGARPRSRCAAMRPGLVVFQSPKWWAPFSIFEFTVAIEVLAVLHFHTCSWLMVNSFS